MGSYFADGVIEASLGILRSMKWYIVTKNIGGRPYLYRQRTYREGGKVRTQCRYVGAAGDHARSIEPDLSDVPAERRRSDNQLFPAVKHDDLQEPGSLPINWPKTVNPLWPSFKQLDVSRARPALKHGTVSISAMEGEYARVARQLTHLELDPSQLPRIRLLEGKKAGWKRCRSGYQVTIAMNGETSGRNRFKRHYRLALAHAMLDQIESRRPSLYDGLRTIMDRSWFNTKMLVTLQILKQGARSTRGQKNDHSRIWLVMQFLWSGELPKAMEQQLGKNGLQKREWTKSAGWRNEAATLIADVMQRGYQPSLKRLAKDRSRAKTNAKRAFTAYRKLNPIQRMTAKGRKKWKLYKKHEASFLLAHHRQSRLEMLKPFLGDFHKIRR